MTRTRLVLWNLMTKARCAKFTAQIYGQSFSEH